MPMTAARKRALCVLYRAGRRGARVSNITEDGGTAPKVYWQTAAWLTREGLVECFGVVEPHVRLTLKGDGVAGAIMYPGERR
jgi:hypothetical protein